VCARKIELLPVEAYSWMWSRHPQLGYFDHPALTSWIVRASTALAGHSFLGVRALTIACSIATVWFVFDALSRLYGERVAEHVALLVLLLPVTAVTGAEATPDSPLLLFWSATLWAFVRALSGGGTRAWLLAGLFLGLALESKYHAALLGLGLLALLALSPDLRGWLRRREPYLAAIVALGVFSPTLVWNAENGFSSFLYQSARIGGQPFTDKELGNFVLTQLLMVTPVVFAQVCAAGAWGLWRWRESPWQERLLVAISMPTLLLFAAVACFRPVRANWPTPGYLGVIALAGVAAARSGGLGLRLQRATLAVLAVGFLVGSVVVQVEPSDRSNSWARLARSASITQPDFLIASDYHLASELGYSNPRIPSFDLAPLGLPSKSFGDWWHPSEFVGQHAVVVIDSTRPQHVRVTMKLAARAFDRIGEPREVSVPVRHRRQAASFTLVDAWGYRPVEPRQSQALRGQVFEELRRREVAMLLRALTSDSIAPLELGVDEPRMTHHERARGGAGDDPAEELAEGLALLEAPSAAEAGVASDAAPSDLARQRPAEQREHEGLARSDPRPRNRAERLTGQADVRAETGSRLRDLPANAGEEMNVLMSVDEVRGATEDFGECLELGLQGAGDHPWVEPPHVSIDEQPPEGALAGQGEMQPEVDLLGERPEQPPLCREARPARHAAHGRDSAEPDELADGAPDSGSQPVVVGAEHDSPPHHFEGAH
jgi:hypothetical protein